MNRTEDIMKFLCRISSLAVVAMIIYTFYLLFKLIFVYGEISFFTIGGFIISFPSILFYFPFFYYAWFEKTDSKIIKKVTKAITVFLAVIFIIVLISSGVEGFLATESIEFLYLALLIVACVPLYYFGWRKNKK